MSFNKWYGYEFYDTFNNILVLFEDKPEYLEKKTYLLKVTDKLYHTLKVLSNTHTLGGNWNNTFTGDWHRLQKSI